MRRTEPRALRVAVVGATGMVGGELLALLERRRFPVGELLPFSSGSARKSVRFRGRRLAAPGVDPRALSSCRLAFFVSADEVSEKLAPALARGGTWVIDDSAAFRLAPEVPLVIPEVNAVDLSENRRLIAGPNCTMTGLAVAAHELHRRFHAVEARIASYQAVSGAGRAALEEFLAQTRRGSRSFAALPGPIAGNVLPQVGSFDGGGHSSEERKVADELRKVWAAPRLKVSVTAVRVPVVRGHSLAVWLRFRKPVAPAQARALLRKTPGVNFLDAGRYPTPLDCAGRDAVFAARLRQGVDARELCLWVVSDNLLKGAALNSVQIAEELLRRGWL